VLDATIQIDPFGLLSMDDPRLRLISMNPARLLQMFVMKGQWDTKQRKTRY